MMSNYTTKKELLEMIKDIPDDTPIVLCVRGNSTKDYEVDMKMIAYENDNGVLIIKDSLSY